MATTRASRSESANPAMSSDMAAPRAPDGEASQSESAVTDEQWRAMQTVLNSIYAYRTEDDHDPSKVFHRKVNRRALPEYYEVIKEPMALSTVKANINNRTFRSFSEFVRDFALIPHNAQLYNRPEAPAYQDALVIKSVLESELQKLVEQELIAAEEAVLPDLGEIPPPSPGVADEDDGEDEDEDDEDDEDEDNDDSDEDGGRRRRRRGPRSTAAITKRDSTGRADDALKGNDAETRKKRGRPPRVDTPMEARIKAVLKGLRKLKDPDGELKIVHFEKLPDKSVYPGYFTEIQNPMALDMIKRKVKRKKYQSVDQVMVDVETMFENAKSYNRDDSQIYKDAVDLQEEARMLAGQEKKRPDSDFVMEDGKLPLPQGIVHRGELWKVGDWVHIQNPNDLDKPIVAQIYRTWQDAEGQNWVNTCWYYRPEQTVHRFERHFFENEVVKTGQYRDHNIEEVVDRCFVMFFTRYNKGRPRGFPPDKAVYVCESRYNEEKFRLNKIKTWASCLPDEVRDKDYEMDLFEVPRRMKKMPSPIRHLLPAESRETDDLPKPTWGVSNAPPVLGAVHRRPRESNESPPPEPTPSPPSLASRASIPSAPLPHQTPSIQPSHLADQAAMGDIPSRLVDRRATGYSSSHSVDQAATANSLPAGSMFPTPTDSPALLRAGEPLATSYRSSTSPSAPLQPGHGQAGYAQHPSQHPTQNLQLAQPPPLSRAPVPVAPPQQLAATTQGYRQAGHIQPPPPPQPVLVDRQGYPTIDLSPAHSRYQQPSQNQALQYQAQHYQVPQHQIPQYQAPQYGAAPSAPAVGYGYAPGGVTPGAMRGVNASVHGAGAMGVPQPPRPVEVYHLTESVQAAIPGDIRQQFQQDDEGRILFFTAPPIDPLNPILNGSGGGGGGGAAAAAPGISAGGGVVHAAGNISSAQRVPGLFGTNEPGKLPLQHSAKYLAFKARQQEERRRKRELEETTTGQTANAGAIGGRSGDDAAAGHRKRRRFDAGQFAATGTLVRATSPGENDGAAANADNQGATGTTHGTGNSVTTEGLLPAAWRGNYWGYLDSLWRRSLWLDLNRDHEFFCRMWSEVVKETLALWTLGLEHGQAALIADRPIHGFYADLGAVNAQATTQPQGNDDRRKEEKYKEDGEREDREKLERDDKEKEEKETEEDEKEESEKEESEKK